MISITRTGADTQNGNKPILELRGLSTDTKPTDVSNGSIYIEINTGKVFMFDAENEQWKEI